MVEWTPPRKHWKKSQKLSKPTSSELWKRKGLHRPGDCCIKKKETEKQLWHVCSHLSHLFPGLAAAHNTHMALWFLVPGEQRALLTGHVCLPYPVWGHPQPPAQGAHLWFACPGARGGKAQPPLENMRGSLGCASAWAHHRLLRGGGKPGRGLL